MRMMRSWVVEMASGEGRICSRGGASSCSSRKYLFRKILTLSTSVHDFKLCVNRPCASIGGGSGIGGGGTGSRGGGSGGGGGDDLSGRGGEGDYEASLQASCKSLDSLPAGKAAFQRFLYSWSETILQSRS